MDILIILMERETATIVGKPSGTEATIRMMPVMKASAIASSEAVPADTSLAVCSAKMAAEAPAPSMVMVLPSLESFSCSGVLLFSVEDSPLAISPNWVASPTAVTAMTPLPPVMKQPE